MATTFPWQHFIENKFAWLEVCESEKIQIDYLSVCVCLVSRCPIFRDEKAEKSLKIIFLYQQSVMQSKRRFNRVIFSWSVDLNSILCNILVQLSWNLNGYKYRWGLLSQYWKLGLWVQIHIHWRCVSCDFVSSNEDFA